jgi:hypothetical protein
VTSERSELAVEEVHGFVVLDAADGQQPTISKEGFVGAADVRGLNTPPAGTTASA